MRRGGANQYAPMAGLPALREAIAAKVAEVLRARRRPGSDVTVTSGGTEALFCAIQALVRAGDEVIVLDPAYDSYEPSVTLAGGRTVHVPLRRPGFGLDWEQVRAAITPRTRLLILNFPHNPSGAVLEAATWTRSPTCCATRCASCWPTRSTSTWSSTAARTTAC